ncbi:hypothetical protein CDAR_591251 [Caerostris darwini]|uniref:Transposase n=1 Tax=Caerostris darwini TaxID=1538125 RepID=A0AAV4RL23_9ARAC|nr:hypothetical protein CDAR_591251 [Caerostris darwini]
MKERGYIIHKRKEKENPKKQYQWNSTLTNIVTDIIRDPDKKQKQSWQTRAIAEEDITMAVAVSLHGVSWITIHGLLSNALRKGKPITKPSRRRNFCSC